MIRPAGYQSEFRSTHLLSPLVLALFVILHPADEGRNPFVGGYSVLEEDRRFVTVTHYEVINPVDPNLAAVQGNPALLSANDYAPATDNQSFYVWTPMYILPNIYTPPKISLPTNGPRIGIDDLANLTVKLNFCNNMALTATTSICQYMVSDLSGSATSLPVPPTQIRSLIIKGELMDFQLLLLQDRNSTGFFHFDSAIDFPRMCLKKTCATAAAVGDDNEFRKEH